MTLAQIPWDNPLVYLLALAVVTALVRIGMWVGGANEHKSTVSKFMSDIREDITEIREDIKKLLRRTPTVAVSSGSPLGLTDVGKTVAAELDASSWAKQTAEGLRDRAGGEPPYEIQELCFDYVRSDVFQPPEDFSVAMKTSAYDHGIDEDQVRAVLAIVLRDVLVAG